MYFPFVTQADSMCSELAALFELERLQPVCGPVDAPRDSAPTAVAAPRGGAASVGLLAAACAEQVHSLYIPNAFLIHS